MHTLHLLRTLKVESPVGWYCRICRPEHCTEVEPFNECPDITLNPLCQPSSEYTDCISAVGKTPPSVLDMTQQSDGKVPVMLEFWRMQSTPSKPSPSGPLGPGVVAPDRVLSRGRIELKSALMLNWIVWNRTVYMYKNGFGINNLQGLMCHKTKSKQTIWLQGSSPGS